MATLSLQRSKELLEKQGFSVWIVEKWQSYFKKNLKPGEPSGIRVDLFNMADLVAIKEGQSGVVAVQACGEDIMPHIAKLLGFDDGETKVEGNKYLPIWLKTGNPFFLWSWRKRGERGKRKTWQLREIEFLIQDGQVVHREVPHD